MSPRAERKEAGRFRKPERGKKSCRTTSTQRRQFGFTERGVLTSRIPGEPPIQPRGASERNAMISRSHWIITAITTCHLLAVHSLVTSQSLPPCSPPESQDESTICAQQQEKDGTVYKLHGNARIFYRSYLLSADEVTYDAESGEATAEGHVVLEGGANDEHIEATRGAYNVQTEFGSFYNVAGTTGLRPRGRSVKLISDNPFAFSGKLVEKRGPGRFVVHDGTVTTCQLPQPKWQFHAARVTVEAAGEARIYNSSFWVHGVPMLYLPFATHPLTKEPHESGFLIPHFGRSSRKGAVIGEGYFWAINRSMDLTLSGEYYSQRGGSQNGNFRWRPTDSAFLEVANVEEGGVGWRPPKIAVLRPTALRVVLAAQGQIHAAIDSPKIPLTDHRALAGGTAKVGDQESRLMRLFRQGVSGERQIEHWHAVDPKTAVVNPRLAGCFHRYPGRVKLPLRLRQLASGDSPIVDHESSRSALFH